MNPPMIKDSRYYMSLHYAILLFPEEDNSWSAVVPELVGCVGAGDTPQEALEALEQNKQLWFAVHLEKQWHIPEPTTAVQQLFEQTLT